MYQDLRTIFHQDENLAKKTYQERFKSPNAHHLDIYINDYQAFYIITPEIMQNLLAISKQDKQTYILTNQLPDVALSQHIKQCLIDEVTATNEIEGVYSSRQEINKVIENLEKQNNKTKFLGLVKSYYYLGQNNEFTFKTCKDIRKAYDKLLLNDIVNDNPKNKPDGKLFRKGPVSVTESGKGIHNGVLPEEKIIELMEKSLDYFNNSKDYPLLKAAVFHYVFGYIHPYYDGNGRLSRFISSWAFSKEYEAIVGVCFSLTIKKNLNKYYKAFKTCNHILNKADITPFVDFFVSMVLETITNLNKNLKEKLEIFKNFQKKINKLPHAKSSKYLDLYNLLLQATLFSEAGISTKDLLSITDTTRTTLRKRLNTLGYKNLLSIEKIGNEKFYKLALS